MKTVRVTIHGRVQGVGYRSWTIRMASQHRLKGWVRNLNYGAVEAVFHGEADAVEAMLKLCMQGPELAQVERIHRFEAEAPLETMFVGKPTV